MLDEVTDITKKRKKKAQTKQPTNQTNQIKQWQQQKTVIWFSFHKAEGATSLWHQGKGEWRITFSFKHYFPSKGAGLCCMHPPGHLRWKGLQHQFSHPALRSMSANKERLINSTLSILLVAEEWITSENSGFLVICSLDLSIKYLNVYVDASSLEFFEHRLYFVTVVVLQVWNFFLF